MAKKATAPKSAKVKETAVEETVETVAPEVVETVDVAEAPKAQKSEAKETSPVEKKEMTAAMAVNADGELDLKVLLEAGVHFGHQAQRWNPKMNPYIYAAREGVHIFDLVKTGQKLKEAMDFARNLGKQGKTLVFVGTKRQAQEIVKSAAEQSGAMYIMNRWLGGLLTNWEQVSKSIRRMNKINTGLGKGEFDHYTKYEKVQLQKDADRLARFFAGISELNQMPDALFLIDVSEEKVAVKEAKLMGIPMIAIVDTNGNPDGIEYVIPGNDDAVSSITILTGLIAQAYAEGRQARSK